MTTRVRRRDSRFPGSRVAEFHPSSDSGASDYCDLIRLWMCRGAELLPVQLILFDSQPKSDTLMMGVATVRRSLQLQEGTDFSLETIRELRKSLEQRHDLEDGILFDNLRKFGRQIGITQTAIRVLGFRILLRLNDGLAAMMLSMFSGWTDVTLQRRLSLILGEPEGNVSKALSENGILLRSRMVRVDSSLKDDLAEKIGLSPGLINNFIRPHKNVTSLMSFIVKKAPAGTLSISDYPHLKEQITLALSYLRTALSQRRRGVNLLLYGVPGTGKTELAKSICKELKWTLVDICSGARGDGLETGWSRIGNLFSAQRVLCRSRRVAILFDEAEEALAIASRISSEPANIKQSINEFMEEAPVPTFWITNHAQQLDRAFLRRFDIVIAVDRPPRSVRRAILADASRGMTIDDSWLDLQSEVEHLTPALITRMASVARLSGHKDAGTFMRAFSLLRDQQFRVNEFSLVHDGNGHTIGYDFATVNASTDLSALCKHIGEMGRARLLLYGAPGTGKSAFAAALARRLDRPLYVKQASDFLSMWVGGTERNIRHAFERAVADDALLLIDEVDSFLRSRERAANGWEITQVNELLTQIERYQGIVVCTTNLMDSLDPAAMRRFDAKVEFRPLRPEQCYLLFTKLCQQMGVADPGGKSELIEDLSRLNTVTPGDFASVARQMHLVSERDARSILEALVNEQRFKPATPARAIGFLQ